MYDLLLPPGIKGLMQFEETVRYAMDRKRRTII